MKTRLRNFCGPLITHIAHMNWALIHVLPSHITCGKVCISVKESK